MDRQFLEATQRLDRLLETRILLNIVNAERSTERFRKENNMFNTEAKGGLVGVAPRNPPGEVSQALEQIEQGIGLLDEAVDRMRDMLDPILQVEAPATTKAECGRDAAAAPTSALGVRLVKVAYHLHALADGLVRLRNRVAL